MKTEDYDTLSQVMERLRNEGYTDDMNLQSDHLECRNGTCRLSPKDFQVDRIFRFEGPTDPGDEAILYAISSDTFKLKGLLVNGYGIYSDETSNDLVRKLSLERKP
jgi:hypothetical protein